MESETRQGTGPGLQPSKLHHKIGLMIVLPFLLDNYPDRTHRSANVFHLFLKSCIKNAISSGLHIQ